MKVTYEEIADLIGRTEANIKYMKKNNPNQLELLTTGAICKKYNIELKDLKALIQMKEGIK
jgi:predicted transcriptional regulator